MITKQEYQNFTDASFTVLPLAREISAPGETPLSLFKKISDIKNAECYS